MLSSRILFINSVQFLRHREAVSSVQHHPGGLRCRGHSGFSVNKRTENLCAFAKLRKVTISSVMSVRLCVLVNWLSLDGYSWNLIFEDFSENSQENPSFINPLTPNDPYKCRTAPLTSKRFILCIYSPNIGTEYFKHGIYSPFFSLQNAVCFMILTYLVPVLFTFYIQGVLKLKKK